MGEAPVATRATLEVVAIEVDGICDEIAAILSKYPGLPEKIVRQLTRAAAELIGARFMAIEQAER
jgi:hypothetical protein